MQDKTAAQNELVRTLDALVRRGAAVLVTSSRPLGEDAQLGAGLRSRLLSGLTVVLSAPGPPARRRLLRRLAAIHNVRISEAAIELLACHDSEVNAAQWTVPRLRQSLLQLGHSEQLGHYEVDEAQVRRYLDEQAQQDRPALRSISAAVAKYFALTSRELRGPSRRRHVVRARGVAMLLAWKLTGKSLGAVGRFFGKRDHTTVLHACRKTESLQQSDPEVAQAIDELGQELRTS
jgi:chromosomal replication initiator protein